MLGRLFIWLALSAVLGYLFGLTWFFISLALLGALVWHYVHLQKLVNWLWQSKAISPPESSGTWGRIYDGLYRLIQKHRKEQKALNERLRRFRDGAEALPDGALVLDNDLTIRWGNKKAQSLIGIKWPSDAGQRVDNLIRFPEFTAYIEEGDFDQPCHLPSPLNKDIQLEIRMMSYGSDQILFLARDVSKIHRIEEMRRDFVANVSHELKTPLTVVRGYVEMVQSSGANIEPQWLKAFNTIEDQVTRMDRLVEQLLVLSRVEVNTDADTSEEVDVSRLIYQLVEEVKWLNIDKKHTINIHIDEEVNLIASDTELKSAFSNLITNAIAYTPANGIIDINWRKQGQSAIFSVIDNGVGIRQTDLLRLTERFYRVDKSRSRSTGGAGLGLAIVKHVANHHNAEFNIKSEWKKGSEFSLVFSSELIVVKPNVNHVI